jgi:hypothetical protein
MISGSVCRNPEEEAYLYYMSKLHSLKKADLVSIIVDDRKDLIRTTNDFNEVNRENWQLRKKIEYLEWLIEDMKDLDNEAGN